MIYENNNYRQYLQHELTERIRANDAYSLRAFARHLDVSPSLLSDVLKGKKNLSAERALKVAEKLKLTLKEKQFFVGLVNIENAKSAELKIALTNELKENHDAYRPKDLSLEAFRVISEWYHLAMLEICDIDRIHLTDESASTLLGISIFEARQALNRLSNLELIEERDGRWVRTQDNLLAKSAKPNEALRKFHKQMLEKAIQSLEQQSPQEKLIGSETLAFNSRDLEKANQIIEECFNKIVKLGTKQTKRDSVYHLGIQFFKITKQKGASK